MSERTAGLDALYPEMVERRRYLHQHPELSFHEVETPRYIARHLKALGIEVKTEVGGRGVVGYIRGGKPGRPSRYVPTLMPYRLLTLKRSRIGRRFRV